MKKLLIFALVLGLASLASAVPVFRVAADDAKDHYTPSEVITIELYDPGIVLGMNVEAISDGGAGGMAEEPQVFNSAFTAQQPGSLNTGGQLVEYMYAALLSGSATGVLYSFEYHVPNVPISTEILIQSYSDGYNWYPAAITYSTGPGFEGDVPMEGVIHVIPEPATIALLGLGGLLLRRKK